MKQSHLTTPRTLNEYQCLTDKEPLGEVIAGYVLALVIGICLAWLLVAWWSS